MLPVKPCGDIVFDIFNAAPPDGEALLNDDTGTELPNIRFTAAHSAALVCAKW